MLAKLFASVTVLGSSAAGWVLVIALAALFIHFQQANARLQAHMATLDAECSEHDQIRRRSAGKVAESIGSLRTRVEELEGELDEARAQEGDADLRIAQLQSQVVDVHLANALIATDREELASLKQQLSLKKHCLRKQQLSLSHARTDAANARDSKQRSDEAADAARASALNELARERHTSNTLRSEIQELDQLLVEARGELARRGAEMRRQSHLASPPWKGDAEVEQFAEALVRGKDGLDEIAVKRIAELLVLDMPQQSSNLIDRQRSQRQLLTCLHPDRWPSSRVATRLMQEVQRSPMWLTLSAPAGGA